MEANLVKKLRRQCRIKARLLREKPRLIFRYVIDALFTWVLGLVLVVLGLMVFPAVVSSASVSGVKLPTISELVSFDKAGQTASNLMERMRQFSLAGLIGWIKEIPEDPRRVMVKLCEFMKRWGNFLGQLAVLILTPRKMWERLQTIWERDKAKIKMVATKALGIAISIVLFKWLMYMVPRLSTSLLTIWGINAGVLILQWSVALVAPRLARKLRRMMGDLWVARKKRKLRETGGEFIENIRSAIDTQTKNLKEIYEYDMGGMRREKPNRAFDVPR